MNPQQQPDDPVKHVVLLMFENHSFDQMLGCFKEVYGLDGVDPKKPGVNQADGKKKQRAIPKLESIIRDASRPRAERHHAIETLGLIANQRFHHEQDPVSAAEAWLRQAGY
jgi:phospholipase C